MSATAATELAVTTPSVPAPVSSDAKPEVPVVVEKHFKKAPIDADYTSTHKWETIGLKEELLKGVLNKNFAHPSKVQLKVLPIFLQGKKDIVVQAKNGSGKTATFCLAMLQTAVPASSNIQCILLTPSHELARQSLEVIKELGEFTGLKFSLIIPNSDPYSSACGSQIVIGTPGKIQELVRKRKIDLSHLKLFVLDEADQLSDMSSSMSHQCMDIKRAAPKSGVLSMLFSATYSTRIQKYVGNFCVDPKMITLKATSLNLSCVGQYFVKCKHEDDKMNKVVEVFDSVSIGQTIIFVNRKDTAQKLQAVLREKGYPISVLMAAQGPTSHQDREIIMNDFRTGVSKVLVATDVIARGVDVPSVTCVINFDLPYGLDRSDEIDAKETYMHRIGRTGRFGKAGIAINLCSPSELNLLDILRKHFGSTIDEIDLDPEEMEAILNQLQKKTEADKAADVKITSTTEKN